MRIIIFLIIAPLITPILFAQENKKVKIISSELLKGFTEDGFIRIIKPIFQQDESTLSADSANFNQEKNTFDAFGHVVITQQDGSTIYADLLNFDGNSKIALLRNQVRLIDKKVTLFTNHLMYNTGTKIGTYIGGGKVVDSTNVLTSATGHYFGDKQEAYFKKDVILTSPDLIIKSDTLKYNAQSNIAYLYGPTNLYGKDDTLYTEHGEYNTNSEQALFNKNNLYRQGKKFLVGDSLFFDRKVGHGLATKNIVFKDFDAKMTLNGDKGVYGRQEESILVTQNAYLVMVTEADSAKVDSIWVAADTLFSKVAYNRDLKPLPKQIFKEATVQQMPILRSALSNTQNFVADSIRNQNYLLDSLAKNNSVTDSIRRKQKYLLDSLASDTSKTRILFAYHKARIFKSDLQATTDSIFFSSKDSIIRCYKNPIIWTQSSQLSADTVYLQLKNKKIDNIRLQHNSFIANTDKAIDSSKFNQIKGKIITGFFTKNKLSKVLVDGNAESISYIKENKSYSGMNRMLSSQIKVLFDNNALEDISFIYNPEGSYYPITAIPNNTNTLPGFIWKPEERPKSKEEIIPNTLERKK